MCCIMCCFKPKCVRWSLFITSFLLIGAAIVAFYYASVFKDDPIFGIIGFAVDFDIQNIMMIISICIGCFILFIMLCGMCIAWKRFCCVQFFYELLLTLAILVFLAMGIILVIIGDYMIKALDDGCEGDDGDIAESLNTLYSSSDEIWCSASTNGCICYLDYIPDPATKSNGELFVYSVTSTYYKVQECTAGLVEAYADYGIDLSDLTDITEFLDYWGDIEKDMDCAGVCTGIDVFYFSDTRDGPPGGSCKSKLKDDLFEGTIKGTGIAYIVTGCMMAVIWFIQYGLCCRKNNRGNPPGNQTKRF